MNLENVQPEVITSAQPIIPEVIANPANALTAARAGLSPFLGAMAANGSKYAGLAIAAVAATDLEGNVARWGARRGKGWLTEIGRKMDPVADKIMAVSVGIGTLFGDLGNTGETALTGSILAEQVTVAGISMIAEKRNPGDLQVSKIGKAGIVLVFGYLTGKNMLNFNPIEQNAGVHDVMSATTTAVGIGSLGVVALAAKGYVKSAFRFGRKPVNENPEIPTPVSESEAL